MTGDGSPVAIAGVPASADVGSGVDRWVRRHISIIWALLVFNVLGTVQVVTIVPIPRPVAQLLTMGALGCALLLAIMVNRRLLFRPNLVLSGFTLLAGTSLLASIQGNAGLGALLRSFRFAAFLAVLWLLTPWWGRRDLLLARAHLSALLAVCATALVGLLIAPPLALGSYGRLVGVVWPLSPPQLAQYAAVAAGMTLALWLSGSITRNQALAIGGGGVVMVILTHTRTALIALATGLVCAALTLFLARRRIRRIMTAVVVAMPALVVALAPAVSNWFTRGQSSEQIAGLTGRKQVWEGLVAAPRSEFEQWFGFGLSDKSFEGLPIDSSWYALYQDQGLVGVAILGGLLLFFLVALTFRPAGPARAVATFLVVYCVVASYTEVGLGDASPYMLHLVVAASLLVPLGQHEDAALAGPPAGGSVRQGDRSSGAAG